MHKNNEKQLFFHVGMPKTASTFLQNIVFPNYQDIVFIKKRNFKKHQKIIDNTQSDKILLSIEINVDKPNGYAKVKTIAGHYPGTKPILVLRKHSSWVRSKYKYYIRKHGGLPFDKYFDLENDQGKIKYENLNYINKIKILEEAFNCRPLVFFQEELKQNPEQFIAQLAEFLQVRYNPEDIKSGTVKKAYSEKQLKYVRRFNNWYNYKDSDRPKWIKFAYKKFSALLLHTVAYAGNYLPMPSEGEPLIPESELQRIDQKFQSDWEQAKEYAKQDRTLLF
ncbi:MAG: hypothetical protein ACOCPM_05040 [Bacteroidales bacterium]